MATIAGCIRIDCAPETVFDFVADERNEPRYNPRMIAAWLLSDPPIGRGSRFAARLRSRSLVVDMTTEFTEFDRPRRLGSVSTAGALETAGAVEFEPDAGGTLMSWAWDVRLRGAAKLLSPLVVRIGRRQERSVWEGLKAYLEGREPGCGTSRRGLGSRASE